MRSKFRVVQTAALFAGISACATLGTLADAAPKPSSHPVIVELFTSEGCNSCPPADRLLRDLEKSQPISGTYIIGLEEHVDYWNRLGWTDPFSSSIFSNRQNDYAGKFGSDTVYTPEMVVDGQAYFVGSDSDRAYQEISKAQARPKAQISLVRGSGGILTVHVTDIPKDIRNAQVYLAVTQSNLISNPTRGENGGATLVHSAVVRSLTKIGDVSSSPSGSYSVSVPVSLSSKWEKSQLELVAFIQTRSKDIIGAGSIGAY